MCEDGLHDPFTDQVECARFKAERDALAQRMEEIASEIDRTLSGVEGIEDAPAMRWMRGLREALGALHSPRTSYEDIEAAKWVRGHGGLDEVNRKVAESMRQADEYIALRCSLAERAGDLYEMLDKEDDELVSLLDKRLMPEGMEWPRFEDWKQALPGDKIYLERYDAVITIEKIAPRYDGYSIYDTDLIEHVFDSGIRLKRPAHKALDAGGVEINKGDTVYEVDTGDEFLVRQVYGGTTEPDFPDHTVRCSKQGDCATHMFRPEQLTHERPDSWERLEEDAGKNPFDYCKCVGHRLDTCENAEAYKARDLVKRAKALAERDA